MFDELLSANRAYAEGFSLPHVPGRAARNFCLVTCMDTRIDPLPMLGLVRGDAKILRNAGARATRDVLRSLVLATTYLDVHYVALMQHTDCALAGKSEDELRRGLSEHQEAAVRDWSFLAMGDPDADLRRDVETIRSFPGIAPGTAVEGWRYDVDSGLIERLVSSGSS